MPLEKFRETTVQGALRATREALGPDALVIGTELVSAQGWRGWLGAREVEVTASAAPSSVSARRPSRVDRRDPGAVLRDGVVARLVASGIERSLADAIATRLEPMECRGSSTASIRRTLADHLTDLIAGDEAFARVEVFVGPPGVGKTTTIAKIAAQT